MNTYAWDTEIGHAVAVAASVEEARAQLLATLDAKDAARDELALALSAEPQVVTGKPFAVVAWH